MSFHRKRQVVLAGNIANIETPGFKPWDLERVGLSPGGFGSGALAATTSSSAGHISAAGPATEIRSFQDAGQTQSANGNAVNLERELSKIDANRVRYDTSSALVSRRLAMLKYAAADGVG